MLQMRHMRLMTTYDISCVPPPHWVYAVFFYHKTPSDEAGQPQADQTCRVLTNWSFGGPQCLLSFQSQPVTASPGSSKFLNCFPVGLASDAYFLQQTYGGTSYKAISTGRTTFQPCFSASSANVAYPGFFLS